MVQVENKGTFRGIKLLELYLPFQAALKQIRDPGKLQEFGNRYLL